MFEIVLNNKKSKYRDKPIMNIDVDDLTSINDSWNKILKIFATTNNLNVVATEIPTVAIPLKIKVDRYTT